LLDVLTGLWIIKRTLQIMQATLKVCSVALINALTGKFPVSLVVELLEHNFEYSKIFWQDSFQHLVVKRR
jgi:hypothetical protein